MPAFLIYERLNILDAHLAVYEGFATKRRSLNDGA
jgi:hypothetical protein